MMSRDTAQLLSKDPLLRFPILMQPATKESRKHRKSESVEIKRISPAITKPTLSEKQVEALLIDNMRLKRELSSLKETITVLKARLLKCGDEDQYPLQSDL